MTEHAVDISITVKAYDEVIHIHKEVPFTELEKGINRASKEFGCKVINAAITGLDKKLSKEVPEEWQNAGTGKRTARFSLGCVQYKRRIYVDETGRRRKPIDEILGIEPYARDSIHVQQMGAWLACEGSYRQVAKQLSWMIKDDVSHSAIQRMTWRIGNRIADEEENERERVFGCGEAYDKGRIQSPVLYGESDGVWLHLQREKRRSAEVRVATMYTGKKPIGKNRHRLENKCTVTAIGMNSEAWQEWVLMTAHRNYDLEPTQLLIVGGDGNQWVRNSFDRFAIKQEFLLDRFHLARAARKAFGNKKKAREIVKQLRQNGFPSVCQELKGMIGEAEGKTKEKLITFYRYIANNQDSLLDLEYRNSAYKPASLGTIEGTLDKLVVHRMKGRGRSWRLKGIRAMLALCQHKEKLGDLALDFTPVGVSKPQRRKKKLKSDNSEWVYGHMPIFYGPDRQKPWVKEWQRYIHDDWSLFSYFYGKS